jgi:uncharacterized protein with beta-barrel porin domain
MKKYNQLSLATSAYRIAALTLALAPFATLNAEDGIATGKITSENLSSASAGQQASFAAMQQICENSNSDASLACSLTGNGIYSAFNGGGGAAADNSLQLQQFSPQAAMQAESIAITSPYQFIRGVNKRLQERRESSGYSRSGGGASSSDAYGFIGPFGVSFSGGGGFGDKNSSTGQTGFKIDTRQANLIIDYSFTSKLTGGFSFGYLGTDRSLGLASGSLDSDSYRFAPFLSYTPTSNSYVTLLGGYALVDFNSRRSVSSVTNTAVANFGNGIESRSVTIPFSDATAKYNADQFFASLGAGYTHRVGAWSLRGYGRGDYSHTHTSDFKESGAVAGDYSYANTINGQSMLSATSTLGTELSYAISTNTLAAVVIPKLYAEWVHEFENSGRQAQTTYNAFKNGTLVAFSPQSITVAGPERNWANVGFGIQMLFPHAIVGYLNYDTLFIQNASNQTVSGGVRVNF